MVKYLVSIYIYSKDTVSSLTPKILVSNVRGDILSVGGSTIDSVINVISAVLPIATP